MEWISVITRLPPIGHWVLVRRIFSDVNTDPNYSGFTIAKSDGDKWVFNHGSFCEAKSSQITHWIEIPPFVPPEQQQQKPEQWLMAEMLSMIATLQEKVQTDRERIKMLEEKFAVDHARITYVRR